MTILKNLFASQSEIINRIHHDFDSAQEKLLDEAKNIINNYSLNEKAERLRKNGFTGSDLVVKHLKEYGRFIKNKEQADLVNYYKFNYPFQKFLTEEQLNAICKKYSLIYAPISAYKEIVPDKNLSDIERSPNLRSLDVPKNKKWCKIKKDNSFFLIAGNWADWCGIWGSTWWRIPRIVDGIHLNGSWSADDYLRENLGISTAYLVSTVANFEEDRQGLFIAAPKSHFNLKGLSKSGEHGMLKTSFTIIKPKDPIVFRYCRGGVQVITKWGLEASDESVVNEINN